MYWGKRERRPLPVMVRDQLGEWLADEQFAGAYGVRGKPGWPPSRLALDDLPDGGGQAFIKVCAYFPYPVKVWLNGHEWAKRQLARAGIGFTELSNGFASCQDPAMLRRLQNRDELQARARAINTRLLETEKAGPGMCLR